MRIFMPSGKGVDIFGIDNRDEMITASIVTYNSDREELRRVIASTATEPIEHIYVVDNSPSDALRDFVAGLSGRVEYFHGQGNVGYGAGHNIAIRAAIETGAKYHVVINPDIFFEQGVLSSLRKYMDENPEVGQVMPRIVYPDGSLQYLCKLLPTPMDLIGRRFIPVKNYIQRRNEIFEMRKSGYSRQMEVPFLSGCFMFLRMSALKEVAGFSDRYFMYCEDIDLCRRISAAGYKTMYNPEVTVVHAHKKESYKSRKMLLTHVKSAIIYFNRWGWLFDRQRRRMNKEAKKQY